MFAEQLIFWTMALQFAPTMQSDQPALLKFLLEIFQPHPEMNLFRPEVLHWKYFAEHPDWDLPRSFILKRSQQIVAHGGVWPIRVAVPGAELKAIHLIDWAASRATPGAGIQLLRHMSSLADLMVTIGGSADTRKLLPKIGYKSGGAMRRYVRVLRPWLQLRTSRQHNWKTPLRFLRNAISTLNLLPPTPPDWQSSRVCRFAQSQLQMFDNRVAVRCPRSMRTPAGLNHMLDCPAAEFTGFAVSEAKQLRGYFLLSKVGRQARIVDVQIVGDTRDAWRPICALAAHAACEDPHICEVVAGTSSTEVSEVLENIGFWLRRVDPIYYYDPCNLLGLQALLHLSLIDGDLSFLYDPQFPYIT